MNQSVGSDIYKCPSVRARTKNILYPCPLCMDNPDMGMPFKWIFWQNVWPHLLRNKMGIYAKWEAIGCIWSEFPLSIRSIRCRSTWPLLMIFIMNFNSPKYGASRHPYWIMALLHFKLESNNCTVVLGTVLKITFHLLITGSFGVVGTKVLSFEPSLDV